MKLPGSTLMPCRIQTIPTAMSRTANTRTTIRIDCLRLVLCGSAFIGKVLERLPVVFRKGKKQRACLSGAVQQCFDLAGQRLWLRRWPVAINDLALPVYQEFGEIPLDRLGAQDAALLALEIWVKRVSIGAVHVDLGEDGETHA